ncbi:MAG: hypothetical protein FWC85_00265 [Elusimicrobia bacterium]|nr:hypothetical protein [Elusimicrobiota bacterium]
MKQFKPLNKISLSFDDVFTRLGKRLNTEVSEELKTRVADIINLSEKILDPKTAVSYGNTQVVGDLVIFDTGLRIYSQTVAKLFEKSFKGYGFLVTAGEAISEKMAECLSEKNVFDALAFDACGSVAVETMASYTYETICKIETALGNSPTKRFSPGYPGWDLSAQEYFLSWLGAENIGVWLTESFMMMPEKSISATLGIEKG